MIFVIDVVGVIVLAIAKWYFQLDVREWLFTVLLAGIVMVVISLMQQITWVAFFYAQMKNQSMKGDCDGRE